MAGSFITSSFPLGAAAARGWRRRREEVAVQPPAPDLSRFLPRADWEALPRSMRRRFESGCVTADYRGSMTFSRSRVGLAFAWLAKSLGGPLPTWFGDDVPTLVRVRATADGVVWERNFGAETCVRSVKSIDARGSLVERTSGGLSMTLDVSVEDGALVFTSRGFFLAIGRWRLPVSELLTPGACRVEHRAVDDRRFRFTMTMTHKLWGVTFRQTGIFSDPEHST